MAHQRNFYGFCCSLDKEDRIFNFFAADPEQQPAAPESLYGRGNHHVEVNDISNEDDLKEMKHIIEVLENLKIKNPENEQCQKVLEELKTLLAKADAEARQQPPGPQKEETLEEQSSSASSTKNQSCCCLM